MKCCKCGNGIESNRSFYPVEPPGKGRKWGCEVCIDETKEIKSENKCSRKKFCFICDDLAKCLVNRADHDS